MARSAALCRRYVRVGCGADNGDAENLFQLPSFLRSYSLVARCWHSRVISPEWQSKPPLRAGSISLTTATTLLHPRVGSSFRASKDFRLHSRSGLRLRIVDFDLQRWVSCQQFCRCVFGGTLF